MSDNTSIDTSGANGIGIDLHKGAILRASDTNILTMGATAAGLSLGGGDASTAAAAAAELNNVSINTLGTSSAGIFVANSGSVKAHGSSVVSAQSYGVQFSTGANNSFSMDAGSGIDAGQAIVIADQSGSNSQFSSTDSTLTSRGGSGFVASNGAHLNATLINSAVDVGAGGLIAQAGNGGQLILNSSGTALTGGMHVLDSASTLSLNLNGAQWIADGNSSLTNLAMDSGSVVNVSQGHAVGGVLTVKGNLIGNGTIALNTVLGGDDSNTDKVVIDGGHASGQTTLAINNVGGTGSQTNNGIMVVEAINSGTSDIGSFKMDAPVRAGAFDYRLFRGGQNATQSDNWYLRDTYNPDPVMPDDPVTPIDPNKPEPGDAGGITPPVPQKIFGPELSVYGSVMPTAVRIGQATLGSLDSRLGQSNAIATDAQSQSNPSNGAWGRVFGQSVRDNYSSIVDPSVSTKIGGFQAGVDILNLQQAQGERDRIGAYLGFAHADANVDGTVTLTNADGSGQNVRQNTGSIKLDGWSVGAYWTHFGQSGWYTDAVLQGTVYNGNASTDRASVGVNGTGITASVEGGYPFVVGKNLTLEPQAQLIYQNVNLKDAADSLGSIDFGSSNSVLGRIGAKLQYTHQDGNKLIQPYLKANLWSTLGGTNSAVNYGGVDSISTKTDGSWGEMGAGVTAKVSQKVSLNAHVNGLFSMGGQKRSGVDVGATLKYEW
ncbi:autotransporter outer membrane beta-barrel domain-containing protein [Collimonas sp. NPDC087041]|uniref:autotransporter family protein n=1 Tax=Collimonas sp. NPDC087041 TaxID=3363960 RepID=UPI00381DBC96